ncbi:MAG: hypothetical protein Q7T97_03255 [Burkholderiaceae bacterium]|nr:hypothetical protein [Burkholderiaceae bacterium]
MVRTARHTSSESEANTVENTSFLSGFHSPDGGIGAARGWMNGSLSAAQHLAAWLEQSQKLNAEAVHTWHANLDEALREAEQAEDLQKLISVATHLLNRQMSTAMQQFGSGVRQAMETEAEWMERLRKSTLSASQQMLQTGMPVPSGEGGNGSPLLHLGQAQAEWLAMTQRWIDSVKAAQVPLP